MLQFIKRTPFEVPPNAFGSDGEAVVYLYGANLRNSWHFTALAVIGWSHSEYSQVGVRRIRRKRTTQEAMQSATVWANDACKLNGLKIQVLDSFTRSGNQIVIAIVVTPQDSSMVLPLQEGLAKEICNDVPEIFFGHTSRLAPSA